MCYVVSTGLLKNKGMGMKFFKIICSSLLLVSLLFLNSCRCESARKNYKHWKSSVIGLKRTVSLLSCSDGKPIRVWSGRFLVEVSGNTISWIDGGKEYKIAGCFIVEEE